MAAAGQNPRGIVCVRASVPESSVDYGFLRRAAAVKDTAHERTRLSAVVQCSGDAADSSVVSSVVWWFFVRTHRVTCKEGNKNKKQTNKQTHKQTNKPTNQQTSQKKAKTSQNKPTKPTNQQTCLLNPCNVVAQLVTSRPVAVDTTVTFFSHADVLDPSRITRKWLTSSTSCTAHLNTFCVCFPLLHGCGAAYPCIWGIEWSWHLLKKLRC